VADVYESGQSTGKNQTLTSQLQIWAVESETPLPHTMHAAIKAFSEGREV
jgi:hypothetical protein